MTAWRDKKALIEEVSKLRGLGFTLEQIGRFVGLSKSRIGQVCKDCGLSRYSTFSSFMNSEKGR